MFQDAYILNGASKKRVYGITNEELKKICGDSGGGLALQELKKWQSSGGQSELNNFGELKTKLVEAQKNLLKKYHEIWG